MKIFRKKTAKTEISTLYFKIRSSKEKLFCYIRGVQLPPRVRILYHPSSYVHVTEVCNLCKTVFCRS